jgi:hypothetical protein
MGIYKVQFLKKVMPVYYYSSSVSIAQRTYPNFNGRKKMKCIWTGYNRREEAYNKLVDAGCVGASPSSDLIVP